MERGNTLGLLASWFNVTFHAMTAWLEMRQLPTDLRGLRPKRFAIQPPRWFTAAEARRLIRAVNQRSFRLFFQVMLATGMRVSEVIAMRVRDLDPERPLIRIPCGKGGDGRLVTFSPTLRARLRDYWRTALPSKVILRLVKEQPIWGQKRIAGMVAILLLLLSPRPIAAILDRQGLKPAPQCSTDWSWKRFVTEKADAICATDFITVETWELCWHGLAKRT